MTKTRTGSVQVTVNDKNSNEVKTKLKQGVHLKLFLNIAATPPPSSRQSWLMKE